MAQVITRPGEGIEPQDLTLKQAYKDQDQAVIERLQAIARELAAFADDTLVVAVLGFDSSRYNALRRDARQASSDLHRSLERWKQSVTTL